MSWLLWANPTFRRGTDHKWVDCLAEPAPTILADGLFGDVRSHYSLFGPPAPDGPQDLGRGHPAAPGPPPSRRPAVADVEKPPYRIPTVAEIGEREGSSGLVAVSTFAGAGGSSTGYRWAGFRVPWASEFLDAAADSYEANWPGCDVDRRDVREVSGRDVLERIGVDRGDLDLFDGSPPCQPFSMSGKRERNWRKDIAHGDGTTNRGGSEDLVTDWVRLIAEMQPRAAVMENVRGLTVGKAKGYLLAVLREVEALGYNVRAKLLDAQWLGVPQRRVRVFVIAVRKDVGEPVYPDPLPYRYTIADACPWLGSYRHDTSGDHSLGDLDPEREPVPTLMVSGGAAPWHHRVTDRPMLEMPGHGYYPGETIDPDESPAPTVMAQGLGSFAYRIVDRQLRPGFNPGELDPDRDPSSTIQTSPDQYALHPSPDEVAQAGSIPPAKQARADSGSGEWGTGPASSDEPAPTFLAGDPNNNWPEAPPLESGRPRKFTIGEAKRLCGFPDDYVLTGRYGEQWARLGNSVPPPMTRAVAARLGDLLAGS